MPLSDIIYHNVLSILSRHLNPIDLLSLKLTETIFWNNELDKLFYSKVIKNFNDYLICNDISDIKTVVNKINGIYSGSLVLSCILGEHYLNSDIDIWTNKVLWEHSHLMYNRNYKNVFTRPSLTYYRLHDKIDDIEITAVKDFKKHKKNSPIVQFVEIKDDIDIVNYIKNKFDFRICGNIIDFNKNKLIINNIDDLIYKRLIYNIDGIVNDTTRLNFRLNKYLNRGFKINNDKKLFDIFMNIKFKDIIFQEITTIKMPDMFISILDDIFNQKIELEVNILKDIFGDKITCYCPGIKKLEKIPKVYVMWNK